VQQAAARWCERHLGGPVAEQFFDGGGSMSRVHGVVLADGRRVALKLRGAQERLRACAAAHRAAWAAGIGSPRPYAGPFPLDDAAPGGSWVSAEEWVDGGLAYPEGLTGGDVAARYGVLLARIVRACPAPQEVGTLEPPVPWLQYDHGDPARVWPPPASSRWDPHRIEADLPPALLETARRARSRLLADDARTLPAVLGHADLSGINARWFRSDSGPAGDRGWRVVVHDWDSIVSAPEAVIAGVGAADHASTDVQRLASLADGEALLDAYATERGRPWTPLELEVAWAAGTWVAAYNCAFAYLHGRRAGDGTAPVADGLLADAAERLRRAGPGHAGPDRATPGCQG